MVSKNIKSIKGKDGKEMVFIPGGEFLFGPNKEALTLPDYYIDRTPVTNAEYKRFVDETQAEFPAHWRAGQPPAGTEGHPVVHVNYFDACLANGLVKAATGPMGKGCPRRMEGPTLKACDKTPELWRWRTLNRQSGSHQETARTAW
jgi:formylglycine-generating enzyme required for sulfatase activity